MVMPSKYRPGKTQVTLAEYKELIAKYQKENRKLRAELDDTQYGLKWTRGKLIEMEEEIRHLKHLIMCMAENYEPKQEELQRLLDFFLPKEGDGNG